MSFVSLHSYTSYGVVLCFWQSTLVHCTFPYIGAASWTIFEERISVFKGPLPGEILESSGIGIL